MSADKRTLGFLRTIKGESMASCGTFQKRCSTRRGMSKPYRLRSLRTTSFPWMCRYVVRRLIGPNNPYRIRLFR